MVINAAGPWAGAVARLAGQDLPVVPVRHEYFVTGAIPGWYGSWPVLRILDLRFYVRAEGTGILCGGWEPDALSLDPRQVTIGQELAVSPNWDVLSGFAADFASLAPAVTQAEVRTVFRGFSAFSPDGCFIVGPVPELRGFVMAGACNAHGVSGSAGLAQHVLESLQPDPSPYVRSLSPRRFLPRTWDWESARDQAKHVYENYYSLPPRPGARGPAASSTIRESPPWLVQGHPESDHRHLNAGVRGRIRWPGKSSGPCEARTNPANPRYGGRSPQESRGRNGTLQYTC